MRLLIVPSPPFLQIRTSTHSTEGAAAVLFCWRRGESPEVTDQDDEPQRALSSPQTSGADLKTYPWRISSPHFGCSNSYSLFSRVQSRGQCQVSETASNQESDLSLNPGSATSHCVILEKLSNPTDPWFPHQTHEDSSHLKEIEQNMMLC